MSPWVYNPKYRTASLCCLQILTFAGYAFASFMFYTLVPFVLQVSFSLSLLIYTDWYFLSPCIWNWCSFQQTLCYVSNITYKNTVEGVAIILQLYDSPKLIPDSDHLKLKTLKPTLILVWGLATNLLNYALIAPRRTSSRRKENIKLLSEAAWFGWSTFFNQL